MVQELGEIGLDCSYLLADCYVLSSQELVPGGITDSMV